MSMQIQHSPTGENYQHWTPGAKYCYESGQDCGRCDSHRYFLDAENPEAPNPCKMPNAVKQLLKRVGPPPYYIKSI